MMAVSISSWRADCSLGQARCLRDPFVRVFVRLASTRPTTSGACRRRSMRSGRLWPLPLKPVADGQVRQAEVTRKLEAGRLFWVPTPIGSYLRYEFHPHSGDRILLRLVHRDVAYFLICVFLYGRFLCNGCF